MMTPERFFLFDFLNVSEFDERDNVSHDPQEITFPVL